MRVSDAAYRGAVPTSDDAPAAWTDDLRARLDELLDGYRAALLVPVVAAALGVVVTIPGFRRVPAFAH